VPWVRHRDHARSPKTLRSGGDQVSLRKRYEMKSGAQRPDIPITPGVSPGSLSPTPPTWSHWRTLSGPVVGLCTRVRKVGLADHVARDDQGLRPIRRNRRDLDDQRPCRPTRTSPPGESVHIAVYDADR